MANYTLFSFKPFDFDGIFQGNYESFEDLEKEETLFKEKQDCPLELNVDPNPFSNEYNFHRGDKGKK